MSNDLRRMFWPSSIAVVGASPDLATYGGQTLDVLLAHRFPGRVVPVNPKRREVAGIPAAPSVADIGEPIDLAVVVVPAPAVVGVVEDCARAGVGAAVIFSAGFAEAGTEGATRQQELLGVARAAGIRVLGPNCQGFFNVHGGVAATFSPAVDPRRGLEGVVPGNVAVASQSGALGFAVFNAGNARGLGFSHVISCGNSGDVDILDLIELLTDDERTDVILALFEGIRDGPRFRELADRAARSGTRLVASKLGRSAAGSRAAATHTAQLAGSAAAYEAVFERHGVLHAADLEELVDAGLALSRCDPAVGPRVGIVSTSGGAGVWLADACDDVGLEVPELGDSLRERLPSLASTAEVAGNPLDLTGRVIQEANVAATARAFLDDGAHDAVALVTSLSDPLILAREADAFEALVTHASKPLLVLTYTQPSEASVGLLRHLGLPWATGPARVARMIRHLVAAGRPITEVNDDVDVAGPAPSTFRTSDRSVLHEHAAKQLLRAWGVPVPEGALAASADEAAKIAATLGGRVAMKVVSPDIAHKSDVGGVALGVDASGAADAFRDLVARTGAAAGDAAIDGVLVEQMGEPGHEVIVGALHDETFGPLVMLGSGGLDAEVLADTRFLPLPLDHDEAARAIARLRSAPALLGTRGRQQADTSALAELLVRVAALAARGDVAELDLNPVVVHEGGKGATVLDAWVTLREMAC